MRNLIFLFSFLIVNFSSKATHLSGGTITYKYLGNDEYHIILTAYWEGSPCIIPQPLPPYTNFTVEIYNLSGSNYSLHPLPLRSNTIITPYQGSCVPADSCYWLKKVIYSDTITLPSGTGGFHLYAESCCRSNQQNIANPNTVGDAFYTFVPDPSLIGPNNSPEWKKDPPTFYCINTDVNFNNGAYDVDGDSLVYSFYNPFGDFNYTAYGDLPFVNNVPQFEYAPFVAPYHTENVLNLNGTDSLRINQYGHVHGSPDNLGLFAAGIKCEEYRNGILINTIYRDLRYQVINCPQMPLADFIPEVDCAGSGNVLFNNIGNGDSYYWDFDTSFVSNDTSTLMNPSFSYTTGQCYDVMLQAINMNGCISEEIIPVCVGSTMANFSLPSTACDSFVNPILNQSTYPTGSNMNYMWISSSGDTSYLNNATFSLYASSIYTITLIASNGNGCSDTITQSIDVYYCGGFEEMDILPINFYPNPSRDNLYIHNNFGIPLTCVLYDASGKSIRIFQLNNSINILDVSRLDPGFYYIQILENDLLQYKFMKN